MNLLPLALYLAAAVAYALHFLRSDRQTGRLATALLAGGALAHTFVIGMKTMALGYAPIAGTTAALSAFVWLLALAYLYIELTTDERTIGAFIAPLLVALQLIPALTTADAAEPRSAVLRTPLFTLHVASMLFAYASFALACVIGITYVLLFKEIKAKDVGFFYRRLPPLARLDVMNDRAVRIGWLFLTLGVAIGAIWAMRARPEFSDPRVQAMTIVDPKILVALICWAVYSFQLVARRYGWTGRRAALLSAVGFAIVLLNFVPVGYFLTRSHNF
jgi:ABC-type transport system involved in cytochrome c biogenesis permease subunit